MTNMTETLLFASLIVAMILPFSGMQTAKAKEGVSDIGKLTAYEDWLLTNSPSLQGISENEKMSYVSELRDTIGSQTGYEAKVFEKLNQVAEAAKKVQTAKEQDKPKQAIQALEMQYMALYFKLEEYGVTTQDRWEASPEY